MTRICNRTRRDTSDTIGNELGPKAPPVEERWGLGGVSSRLQTLRPSRFLDTQNRLPQECRIFQAFGRSLIPTFPGGRRYLLLLKSPGD